MKRSALLAALFALFLTACGEEPDEAPAALVPAVEPAPVAEAASAVEPASAPEAMDSMKK